MTPCSVGTRLLVEVTALSVSCASSRLRTYMPSGHAGPQAAGEVGRSSSEGMVSW